MVSHNTLHNNQHAELMKVHVIAVTKSSWFKHSLLPRYHKYISSKECIETHLGHICKHSYSQRLKVPPPPPPKTSAASPHAWTHTYWQRNPPPCVFIINPGERYIFSLVLISSLDDTGTWSENLLCYKDNLSGLYNVCSSRLFPLNVMVVLPVIVWPLWTKQHVVVNVGRFRERKRERERERERDIVFTTKQKVLYQNICNCIKNKGMYTTVI